MHAEPHIASHARAAGAASASSSIKPVLRLLLLVAAIVALFAPTALSMLDIWRRSDTFSHGFLVVPAFFYFVWQRRVQLAAMPVRPFAPALLGIASAVFVWLLAELASIASLAQFAVASLVPLAVFALFGWPWVRALAFPLVFLFFAVPFGDVFVPSLIDWTANFTVAALKLSGVPVYREGNFFVIPSGRWSVVEACSGMRYLLASLMAGSLYAWLMYRSTQRRVLFVAAALIVPIIANWLRAYGIVMLGHLSNNRIATGVDHLVYGWVFFGVVMGVMFWIGARWREDGEPVAAVALTPAATPSRKLAAVTALTLLIAAAGPIAHAALKRDNVAAAAALPQVIAVNGWQRVAAPDWHWMPKLQGAAASGAQFFAKDGKTVAVFVGVYRNQRSGAELVSSANVLLAEDDPLWRVAQQRRLTLTLEQAAFDANALLARRAESQAAIQSLAIAQWYWLGGLGGRNTHSDTQAKIDLAFDRLLARDDYSAWIAIYTPADASLAEAAPLLQRFAADIGPALTQALQQQVMR